MVHVWCQLSNHYHLLMETPRGNLSEIMHHINGAYTTYFNVKRRRSGHLFQGRYKAILVEADAYASELSRYIHLNPVRAGLVERPGKYEWSSYRSYVGESSISKWLKTEYILKSFASEVTVAMKRYREFVEDRLGQEYENPLNRVVGSCILGSEDFAEEIASTYLEEMDRDNGNMPALGQLYLGPSLEVILEAVQTFFPNKKQARQAGMYFCHRYSGAKLKEIGDIYGVKAAAVVVGSRRFELQLDEDGILRGIARDLRKSLKM